MIGDSKFYLSECKLSSYVKMIIWWNLYV